VIFDDYENEYEQDHEIRSVFNIGLQNTFVYRWNYFLRALFGLIPLAGTSFSGRPCSRSVAADCTATITAR
jgi:hypothetical protein